MIEHQNRTKFIFEGKRFVKYRENIYKVTSWNKKMMVSLIDLFIVLLITFSIWLIITAVKHDIGNIGKVLKFVFNPDEQKIITDGVTTTIIHVMELSKMIDEVHNLSILFLIMFLTLLFWQILIPSLFGSQTLTMKIFKIEIYDEEGSRAHAGKILIRELINNGLLMVSSLVTCIILLTVKSNANSVQTSTFESAEVFIILFCISLVWSVSLTLISIKQKHYGHTLAELATKTTIVNLRYNTQHVKI